MWVFGHLGIGSRLATPFSRRLPYGWILAGTLLPDIIDKPLYYWTRLEIVSCTRTFGHTGLFVFFLSLLAWGRKSKILAALSLGVATHLILDGFQDYWFKDILHLDGESSLRLAVLFPFYKNYFGTMPYGSFKEHLKSGGRPFTLISELIGVALLALDYWKKRWSFKRLGHIGLPWKIPKAGQ